MAESQVGGCSSVAVWHDATSRSDECGGERASQHASGRVLDDRETMLSETPGGRAYMHVPGRTDYSDICIQAYALGSIARGHLWNDMVGYLYPPIVGVL